MKTNRLRNETCSMECIAQNLHTSSGEFVAARAATVELGAARNHVLRTRI